MQKCISQITKKNYAYFDNKKLNEIDRNIMGLYSSYDIWGFLLLSLFSITFFCGSFVAPNSRVRSAERLYFTKNNNNHNITAVCSRSNYYGWNRIRTATHMQIDIYIHLRVVSTHARGIRVDVAKRQNAAEPNEALICVRLHTYAFVATIWRIRSNLPHCNDWYCHRLASAPHTPIACVVVVCDVCVVFGFAKSTGPQGEVVI